MYRKYGNEYKKVWNVFSIYNQLLGVNMNSDITPKSWVHMDKSRAYINFNLDWNFQKSAVCMYR